MFASLRFRLTTLNWKEDVLSYQFISIRFQRWKKKKRGRNVISYLQSGMNSREFKKLNLPWHQWQGQHQILDQHSEKLMKIDNIFPSPLFHCQKFRVMMGEIEGGTKTNEHNILGLNLICIIASSYILHYCDILKIKLMDSCPFPHKYVRILITALVTW